MADNSYNIEIKAASKNGWFTPTEAQAYYGRYGRDVYIVHWWGNPGQVGTHDATVNYILGTAAAGNMSVNYVLSNGKISLLVNPDNVSWGAQGGNPTGINIEHEPTLNDEGYKRSGWLKEQLEQRYGKRLAIKGHRDYYATACPGTISLDRIEQETDKWRRKEYDQPISPPAPISTPPEEPKLTVVEVVDRTMFTLANAKLVNMTDLSVVKTFPLDTSMGVRQKVRYNNLEFYRTVSATDQNRLQGFLVGDLKDTITEPTLPPVVELPEWEKNLRDIDDTEYWIKEKTPLVDITTGLAVKELDKDVSFIASALTMANGIEYRITDYSFKKGIFNGVPINKLTLTKPGVPNIPPVPDYEQRLSALEALAAKIVQFLSSIFSGFKS